MLVFEPAGDGHTTTVYFRERAGRDSEEFYANPAIGEFWIGPRPSLAHVAADLAIDDPSHRGLRAPGALGRHRHARAARGRRRHHRAGRPRPHPLRRRGGPLDERRGCPVLPRGERRARARRRARPRALRAAPREGRLRGRRDARRDRRDAARLHRGARGAAPHHRGGARRARDRGRLRHPGPPRRQRRRLRLDRRSRAARHASCTGPATTAPSCPATSCCSTPASSATATTPPTSPAPSR